MTTSPPDPRSVGDRLREFYAKTNAPTGLLVLATQADAEHSALLAAEARIAAVRELHNAVGLGAPCRSCRPYTPYPCPTIQALTEGDTDD